MKLLITFSFLVLTIGRSAYAMDENIEAEITQFGIYKPVGEVIRYKNSASPSGYSLKSQAGVRLAKVTDKIPLIYNTQFGYDFVISGFKQDRVIELITKWSYPLIRRPDGAEVTSSKRKQKYKIKDGKIINGSSYVMNNKYELVEGVWNLSFYYNGKEILEKDFHISSEFNKNSNNALK